MKWYGSVENRLEENKMYCKEIEVGTGMTKYSWSDRHAYEVVEVKNQQNVFVREYDAKGVGVPMSNEWELISNPNNPVHELKFRYNHWYWVHTNRDGKKIYEKANVSFGVADYYYDYEF